MPIVSTGYPETEFFPPDGAVNTVYRSRFGTPNGIGYPEDPDDDRDGLIDEDCLRGKMVIGELGLDGRCRPVPGALPYALLASRQGNEDGTLAGLARKR